MNFFKENFAPITALAGAVSALVAIVLGVDDKLVYAIIVLAVFLAVPIAIAIRSRWDLDRDQSQLVTLITNNLRANKAKKYLGLKANIALVGDESCVDMFESLRANLREIDTDLLVSTFIFTEGVDKDLQRDDLLDALSGADSVILVRTAILEKEDWIYEAVDKWAFRNSNVPILVIDKTASSDLPINFKKITEKFYFIPDHQPSLSWRLLKRANSRSLSWRNQSTFNRSVSIAALILLVTLLGVAYLANYLRQRETFLLMRTAYRQVAEHTKGDYLNVVQSLIADPKTEELKRAKLQKLLTDKNFNISYWLTHNGVFYPLATTDPRSSYTAWERTKVSLVGCVLRAPNRMVFWDETMPRPQVTTHNGDPAGEDPFCGYAGQGRRRLHSIACASWSAHPQDADHTVAVCAFTESEPTAGNVIDAPTDLLKTRATEFYEMVSPFIRQRQFLPH